jgi:hypothetical protein
MTLNVCSNNAVVFAAQNDAAEAAIKIHFRRLEPQDQVAAKTMERPQLFLKRRFNRAYQQRERRCCCC